MTSTVEIALDKFIQRTIEHAREQQIPLQIEYDSDWPSPCYQANADNGDWVPWLPVRCQPENDLSKVEAGIGFEIHPSVHRFFGRYYSENINATAERGKLQLLQAWNEQDFERLQQNLIGHLLMKRRRKQPPTLFFALTDEEDFILSIDNQTGEVVLEQVGLLPQEVLAPDLGRFLDSLTPDFAD